MSLQFDDPRLAETVISALKTKIDDYKRKLEIKKHTKMLLLKQ